MFNQPDTLPKPVRWEDTHTPILPDTPEMEAFLGVGYGGLTVADAEAIVAAAKKDRVSVAPKDLKDAQAFLQAYHAKPQVVAKRRMIVPQPLD